MCVKRNNESTKNTDESNRKVQTIHFFTSVTPNGILPTYNRLACLLIALPANGTVVFVMLV